MDEWIKTAWEAAQALGLTSRWEFWVAVLAVFVLWVVGRRIGSPLWLYIRSIKPPPGFDGDGNLPPGAGAPPIPLDKDGTIHLDQTPPKDYL